MFLIAFFIATFLNSFFILVKNLNFNFVFRVTDHGRIDDKIFSFITIRLFLIPNISTFNRFFVIASSKTKNKMKCGFFLNIIIGKSASIFQLLSSNSTSSPFTVGLEETTNSTTRKLCRIKSGRLKGTHGPTNRLYICFDLSSIRKRSWQATTLMI